MFKLINVLGPQTLLVWNWLRDWSKISLYFPTKAQNNLSICLPYRPGLFNSSPYHTPSTNKPKFFQILNQLSGMLYGTVPQRHEIASTASSTTTDTVRNFHELDARLPHIVHSNIATIGPSAGRNFNANREPITRTDQMVHAFANCKRFYRRASVQ